jgi:hypothetical protein
MKVLYMSGYTDDAIVHRGMLEQGTNFMPKPFAPQTLARKVKEALGVSGRSPTLGVPAKQKPDAGVPGGPMQLGPLGWDG